MYLSASSFPLVPALALYLLSQDAPCFFHLRELNKSERSSFSFTGTKDGKWRMKPSFPCDPLRNPLSCFTKLSSSNPYPNPLSRPWVFGVITYFIILEAYLVQFLYCISSAPNISRTIINATQVAFFVCCLEKLTRALTGISPPASSALLSQGPPMVEPGFQHFPTEGHSSILSDSDQI